MVFLLIFFSFVKLIFRLIETTFFISSFFFFERHFDERPYWEIILKKSVSNWVILQSRTLSTVPLFNQKCRFFSKSRGFCQLLKFRYKVHWRPVRGEIVDSPWSIAVERRPLVVNHGVNKNELGHNKVVQFLVLENFERYQKYSFLTFVKSTKTPKYRIVVFIRLIIQSWHHQLNFSVEFSVPQNSNFCPKMTIFIFFNGFSNCISRNEWRIERKNERNEDITASWHVMAGIHLW